MREFRVVQLITRTRVRCVLRAGAVIEVTPTCLHFTGAGSQIATLRINLGNSTVATRNDYISVVATRLLAPGSTDTSSLGPDRKQWFGYGFRTTGIANCTLGDGSPAACATPAAPNY